MQTQDEVHMTISREIVETTLVPSGDSSAVYMFLLTFMLVPL